MTPTLPAIGNPASDTPASGNPASDTPASGTPATGAPDCGSPESQSPKTQPQQAQSPKTQPQRAEEAPVPLRGSVPGVETGARRYFRCERLSATLSLQQCRMNRVKLSYHDALVRGVDPLPPDIQPFACWSCTLAPGVETGARPFFTVEEVLAGLARVAPTPDPPEPLLVPPPTQFAVFPCDPASPGLAAPKAC